MKDYDLSFSDPERAKPEISDVISALLLEAKRNAGTVGPNVVYGLSDLPDNDLQCLKAVWQELSAAYKHKVLRQLNETSEVAFELNFREIALMSLDDESDFVRAAAIDLLWTDETLPTMRRLITMARMDTSADVRTRALAGLGRYILLGEYDDIPKNDALKAQELALNCFEAETEPVEVRCRALEALSNSSHPAVEDLIRAAYFNGNHMLKVSAIFAMGRTCDKQWQDILLDELDAGDNELVYEAIHACGQIQLEESVEAIGELTLGDDREIQLMAIWALGEIGGKRAFDILSSLQDASPEDEIAETIDDALDAASFSLSMPAVDFGFDFN